MKCSLTNNLSSPLVCGELCMHPPQLDLPTGGRVPRVLQTVPASDGEPSRGQEEPTDWMLQPQEQQGSEGGEHQPPYTSSSWSFRSKLSSHFSPLSRPQFSYDATRGMPEDSAPSGVKWLCHPKTMQTYLSLLGSSQKDATLEACCGALQNLTASKGLVRRHGGDYDEA